MTEAPTSQPDDSELPLESALLRAAYKKPGRTVSDLAAASGLSVGTLHIAFSGIRYRDGVGRPAPPADQTLVKVGRVLRLGASALCAPRAASGRPSCSRRRLAPGRSWPPLADMSSVAAVAGRMGLAKQILAAFWLDELQAEIDRRRHADDEAQDAEDAADLAEALTTDRWPV